MRCSLPTASYRPEQPYEQLRVQLPFEPCFLCQGLLSLGQEGGTGPQRQPSQPVPPSLVAGRHFIHVHPEIVTLLCAEETPVGRNIISRGERVSLRLVLPVSFLLVLFLFCSDSKSNTCS